MLDVQAVARFLFKWLGTEDSMEQEEDPEGRPEDRIEAALERIARQLDAPDPVAAEVAARLDHIIATMRQALGK